MKQMSYTNEKIQTDSLLSVIMPAFINLSSYNTSVERSPVIRDRSLFMRGGGLARSWDGPQF